MAYRRRNVIDGQTVMNKDLYDNVQDGIDESKEALNTQAEMLADNYSNEITYSVGENVTYNGSLYKCIEDISEPEDFDISKWEKVQVGDITLNEEVELKILSAENWEDNAYDLSADYPNDKCNITVSAYSSMPSEQLKAYQKAQLVGSNTENVLYATGKVPDISITVMVTITSKGGM